MKVLMVNTHDNSGGAARAAHRLHKGLRSIGIDSQMLVQFKVGNEGAARGPMGKSCKAWAKIRQTLEFIPLYRYPLRREALFSPAIFPFSGLSDRINQLNPDIVHLHWVNDGMLKIEDLLKIKAPIVWSLHDMWPMTGGCHYDADCSKYTSACQACPALGSSASRDLAAQCFHRKQKVFEKLKGCLHIVGLSTWISACARKSRLLSPLPIVTLPNPIDTRRFFPANSIESRRLLGIERGKKIVLFGAMSATRDERKGFSQLVAALRLLDCTEDIELLVFGSDRPDSPPDLPFVVHYAGMLNDDISLQVLYSAATVMVVPSLQENLSNAIMESLACGTPVVAFDTGGNGDMVDHQVNGYLARFLDIDDLAAGIKWVLNHEDPAVLQRAAVEKVANHFELEAVARRYEALYQDVLSRNSAPRQQ